MKYELYKDKKKEWRWRLLASNGRIVADSAEGYKNKKDCTDEIKRIHIAHYGRIEIVSPKKRKCKS